MRPIKINSKKFSDLIDKELKDSNSVLSQAKIALENLYLITTEANQRNALQDCLSDFKSFLLLTPTGHKKLIEQWNNVDLDLFSKQGINKNGLKTQRKTNDFGNKILNALNFDRFRNRYATEIANIINIKSCPYCNSMLTIVLPKKKTEKARFQLDHYYPKSKFPLLSLCFYNLIPSCGHCNQYKGSGTPELGFDFHLYASETPLNGFKFKIPDADIVNYYLKPEIEKINIELLPDKNIDPKYVENHNNKFRITRIYNTQKDVAEEILCKAKAYNKSRISELQNIKGIDLTENEIKRMILSNYTRKDEIHKRPLAKFTQDIARQLKLIK